MGSESASEKANEKRGPSDNTHHVPPDAPGSEDVPTAGLPEEESTWVAYKVRIESPAC